ncbi:hypothetical protein D046_6998, partial [Vibrio parahaemolyticus V-223/04]
KDKKNRPEAVD